MVLFDALPRNPKASAAIRKQMKWFGGPRIKSPRFTLVAFVPQTERLSSCQFLQCTGPKSFPVSQGQRSRQLVRRSVRSFAFDVKKVTHRLFE